MAYGQRRNRDSETSWRRGMMHEIAIGRLLAEGVRLVALLKVMYSNKSPPTVLAGMVLPYISISCLLGK